MSRIAEFSFIFQASRSKASTNCKKFIEHQMFFYGSIHTWAWYNCDYYSPFELEILLKTNT